jgi:hypothetical protein
MGLQAEADDRYVRKVAVAAVPGGFEKRELPLSFFPAGSALQMGGCKADCVNVILTRVKNTSGDRQRSAGQVASEV